MAFKGTRQDVANVVLAVIRAIEDDDAIVENSSFGPDKDIVNDKLARRAYASPIINRLTKKFPDCVLTKFGPDTCAKAANVKAIVDAIWKELQPEA